MAIELVLRFIIGGLVVAAFAVIGDVLKPKTFAGLFCAAPSVGLATIGLTLVTKGPSVASLEGRSMILGAIALVAYSLWAGRQMEHRGQGALISSVTAMGAWFLVAFGLWAVVLA